MLKKILALSLVAVSLHAEICPTPAEIKNNHFCGWQVLDINNGIPLTGQRLEEFKKNISDFQLAEWMIGAPEGEAHCYYGFDDGFLAKHNLVADKNLASWKQVGYDVWQCRSNIANCVFRMR